MVEKTYLSVTALTKYIKYKFDNDVHLENVLLEGEISNFKRHSRGHFYFTLKDQNAQISATMFYSDAKGVLFEPKDGMKVLVKGRVSVYEPQGTYNINVNSMEEKGLGSLYIAYEKLKKELSDAGYFSPIHKKELPKFPKAIGVITSPTGAAVRDCINTITRRYPLAKIYVYPTLVQGEDAKNSIVNNIELANKQELVDVLIVGRGGGSIEDLWAFNEKVVAMAIFNSKLPIISAVGHETDFTIADFVSDVRAATPTAAAELSTPNLTNLKENIDANLYRLEQALKNSFDNAKNKLLYLDQRLESNNPNAKLEKLYQKKLDYDRYLNLRINQIFNEKKHIIDIYNQRLLANNPTQMLEQALDKSNEYLKLLNLNFEKIIQVKMQSLSLYTEKLKVLNPLNIMEKGYSIVLKDDRFIKSSHELNCGDVVKIKFHDGEKKAQIMEDE